MERAYFFMGSSSRIFRMGHTRDLVMLSSTMSSSSFRGAYGGSEGEGHGEAYGGNNLVEALVGGGLFEIETLLVLIHVLFDHASVVEVLDLCDGH